MASLKILPRHLSGLAKLLSVPEDAIRELSSRLADVPVSLDPEEPIRKCVSETSGIPSDDADSIAEAFMSLLLLRTTSNDSLSEFVDELSLAIKETNSEELQFSDEVSGGIKMRLEVLLSNETLLVSTKAVSVMFEHDKLFSKARVLTQLLPIFGSDVNATPKGAVISHQVGIHYFQNGAHKEFFVLLDSDEVEDFIDVLERARAKADALKQFLATTSVPSIEEA
jgi:hypothetical protein